MRDKKKYRFKTTAKPARDASLHPRHNHSVPDTRPEAILSQRASRTRTTATRAMSDDDPWGILFLKEREDLKRKIDEMNSDELNLVNELVSRKQLHGPLWRSGMRVLHKKKEGSGKSISPVSYKQKRGVVKEVHYKACTVEWEPETSHVEMKDLDIERPTKRQRALAISGEHRGVEGMVLAVPDVSGDDSGDEAGHFMIKCHATSEILFVKTDDCAHLN